MLSGTQIEWVKEQLRFQGYITRNQCLRVYINRFGAIIAILKKEGWSFTTGYQEFEAWGKVRKDYVYTLVSEARGECNG